MPTFSIPLNRKHLPGMIHEQDQKIDIEYTASKSATHINVSISKISLTPSQLNYLHYSTGLFAEIYASAKKHAEQFPHLIKN